MLEPPRDARLHQQAVHDDFDGVILALVEARRIIERAQIAVDARAQEAVARELLQFLAVLAFSPAHDGREDHDAVAVLASSPCRMARTICSVDWREIGLPQLGQCGVPIEV